jgi:RNA polymerase sigma factor (sigma-70 family)
MLTTPTTPVRRSPFEVASLVNRAAGGDHDAWDELVDEFASLVWSVARSHRLSDEDAADVSQTTWCKLVEHLGRLKEPGRVGAWLVTTARRESLAIGPRAARSPIPWGDRPPEIADRGCDRHDARLLREERDDALWSAFRQLDERDRALLRLTVTEPAPGYQEVGAALGMPVGSIGPTRGRALDRLRRAVGDDLDLLRLEAA